MKTNWKDFKIEKPKEPEYYLVFVPQFTESEHEIAFWNGEKWQLDYRDENIYDYVVKWTNIPSQ